MEVCFKLSLKKRKCFLAGQTALKSDALLIKSCGLAFKYCMLFIQEIENVHVMQICWLDSTKFSLDDLVWGLLC